MTTSAAAWPLRRCEDAASRTTSVENSQLDVNLATFGLANDDSSITPIGFSKSVSFRSVLNQQENAALRDNKLIKMLVTPEVTGIVEDLGVTLQDWEGCVEDIHETSFSARILDRTRGMDVDTEIAEIPLEKVREGDRELLFPGSLFYMLVRRRTLSTGSIKHSVNLIFRRLPLWTDEALRRVKEEAESFEIYLEQSID